MLWGLLGDWLLKLLTLLLLLLAVLLLLKLPPCADASDVFTLAWIGFPRSGSRADVISCLGMPPVLARRGRSVRDVLAPVRPDMAMVVVALGLTAFCCCVVFSVCVRCCVVASTGSSATGLVCGCLFLWFCVCLIISRASSLRTVKRLVDWLSELRSSHKREVKPSTNTICLQNAN